MSCQLLVLRQSGHENKTGKVAVAELGSVRREGRRKEELEGENKRSISPVKERKKEGKSHSHIADLQVQGRDPRNLSTCTLERPDPSEITKNTLISVREHSLLTGNHLHLLASLQQETTCHCLLQTHRIPTKNPSRAGHEKR